MLIPKWSGWKKKLPFHYLREVTTIWQHTDVTDGSEIPKIIKTFYRHSDLLKVNISLLKCCSVEGKHLQTFM